MRQIRKIRETYRTVRKYRTMISFMALKNLKVSVIQTVLGKLWLLLEPLSHMIIYYFIIVIVFKAGPRYGINPFVFIMMGLSHFLFLQKAVNAAGSSILSRQSILMQLKIEPVVFICIDYYKSCIDFAIFFAIYLFFYLKFGPQIPENVIFYPFILAVLFFLAYNLSIISACLVVVLRDVRNMVAIFMRILMYMSPVIYSIEFIPQQFREFYLYNPLSCLFALFHWSVFNAPCPPSGPIYSMAGFTLMTFILAHLSYNFLKPTFTKVL